MLYLTKVIYWGVNMKLNMYEVLFTILNLAFIIIFVIFIVKFFRNFKKRQQEIMRKLNELGEEIKSIKDRNK
jgi:uncharacterized protein YoxC